MDVPDQIGLVQVECLINVVGFRKPSGQLKQIGAHRAVGEQRLGLQCGEEISHAPEVYSRRPD